MPPRKRARASAAADVPEDELAIRVPDAARETAAGRAFDSLCHCSMVACSRLERVLGGLAVCVDGRVRMYILDEKVSNEGILSIYHTRQSPRLHLR